MQATAQTATLFKCHFDLWDRNPGHIPNCRSMSSLSKSIGYNWETLFLTDGLTKQFKNASLWGCKILINLQSNELYYKYFLSLFANLDSIFFSILLVCLHNKFLEESYHALLHLSTILLYFQSTPYFSLIIYTSNFD